jgi:ComF family protein
LPLEQRPGIPGELICGVCQRHPPVFHRTVAPYIYAAPLDRLIQQFKFNRRLDLARPLAGLMGASLTLRDGAYPQLLVPVPLHPQRLRKRGFNQARELARVIGRELDIPLATPKLCQRLRATAMQADLPARQRQGNVRGAFAVTAPLSVGHVAIVDDVMTTGHTAAELARTLRRAGAESIEVWVCARALPPGR